MVNVILIDRNPDFMSLMQSRIELLGSDHVRIVGVLTDGTDLDRMIDLTHPDMVAVCANALDSRNNWYIPDVKYVIEYTRSKSYLEKYPKHCILSIINTDCLLTFLECYDKDPTLTGLTKIKSGVAQ